MIIRYHGHSEFLIQTSGGQDILFDPFPPGMGFPDKRVQADFVLLSHHHHDHAYLNKVTGKPVVLDSVGEAEIADGVYLRALPAFHDPDSGRIRGETLMLALEAEDLCLVHLGDFGEEPTEERLLPFKNPDILFVPIGGKYTLDAKQAVKAVQILSPRICIPMHYRVDGAGLKDVDGLELFLSLMKPLKTSFQPLLRVTASDLSEQAALVVLSPEREEANARIQT